MQTVGIFPLWLVKLLMMQMYSGALRTGSSNAYVLRTYAEVNGKNEIIYGGVANG